MSKEISKPISGSAWKWRYQRTQPAVIRQSSRLGKLVFQSIIALALAALFAFLHRILFASIVAGIGLLILLVGLFFPRVHSAFERMVAVFAFYVGQCLTWMLLVPFYYLCFFPARILLVLTKRDPMKRSWDPTAQTYWNEKHPIQDDDRMTKQY